MNTAPVEQFDAASWDNLLKIEVLSSGKAHQLEACTKLRAVDLCKNENVLQRLLMPQPMCQRGSEDRLLFEMSAFFWLCLSSDREVLLEVLKLLQANPNIFRREDFFRDFFVRLPEAAGSLAKKSPFFSLSRDPVVCVGIWKILSANPVIFLREDFRLALCVVMPVSTAKTAGTSVVFFFCGNPAIRADFLRLLSSPEGFSILEREDFRAAFCAVLPALEKPGVKTRAMAKKRVAREKAMACQAPVYYLYANMDRAVCDDVSKFLVEKIMPAFSRVEFCKILCLPFPSKQYVDLKVFHVLCVHLEEAKLVLSWLLAKDGDVLQNKEIFTTLLQQPASGSEQWSVLSHLVVQAAAHHADSGFAENVIELIVRVLFLSEESQIDRARQALSGISSTSVLLLESCLKNLLKRKVLDQVLRKNWIEFDQMLMKETELFRWSIRWLLPSLRERFNQLFFDRRVARKELSPAQNAGLFHLLLCSRSPGASISTPQLPNELWDDSGTGVFAFLRLGGIPTADPTSASENQINP